jgi:hypothetical protein
MWGSRNLGLRAQYKYFNPAINRENQFVFNWHFNHHRLFMDFVDAYFFSSPASVFVAVVTFAFLAIQAWPRKQTDKLSYASTTDYRESDLSVSKEPEVPEGWWSNRDVFELERRSLFSQVTRHALLHDSH